MLSSRVAKTKICRSRTNRRRVVPLRLHTFCPFIKIFRTIEGNAGSNDHPLWQPVGGHGPVRSDPIHPVPSNRDETYILACPVEGD